MTPESELVPYTGVTSTAVAGLFDPSSPESLGDDERILLTSLIDTDDNLEAVMPDDLNAKQIWANMELCCKVFVRIRRASAQLKLLIGRSLVLIQNNPMVFERRGFGSFDQFISNEETGLPFITGISRGELYKAKSVAEAAPRMSLSDAKEIGWTKLAMVSRITKEGDSDFGSWMTAAKTDTIPQLQERIYRSDKQIPDGDLAFDVLQLTVTKSQKDRFSEFSGNPKIQAYCGTQSPGSILERMIEEVENQWLLDVGAAELDIPQ